jgi:hypothetical protein
MLKRTWPFILMIFLVGVFAARPCNSESSEDKVCRPRLDNTPLIELGKAGQFNWYCPENPESGKAFYIVFIRPVGTYILLKVPHGRTSFEFAPDTPGKWRWIVINTDPDRGKPDVESEPSFFQVTSSEQTAN